MCSAWTSVGCRVQSIECTVQRVHKTFHIADCVVDSEKGGWCAVGVVFCGVCKYRRCVLYTVQCML